MDESLIDKLQVNDNLKYCGEQGFHLTFEEEQKQAELKLINDLQVNIGPFLVLIRQYVPPVLKPSGLIMPNTHAKLVGNVGYIMQIGCGAFRDKKTGDYLPFGPNYKVGDWVVYSKHHGAKFDLSDNKQVDLPLTVIFDDQVIMTIKDPSYVNPPR